MSTSDEHRAFVRLLFERHGVALKRHVVGLLGRVMDAEDIVQETMSRLLDHEDLERHEAQARSYMYRTATNLVYDHHRRRREESLDDPSSACHQQQELADPGSIVDLDMALEAITRTLLALKPRCRQVFLLRTSEGLSYEAIAERLDISKRTVEREMKHALDACQRRLRRTRDLP